MLDGDERRADDSRLGAGNQVTVRGVKAAAVRARLDELRPYLEQFLNRGETTVERLVAEIEGKARQAWMVYTGDELSAVALTYVSESELTVCQITHLAGARHNEWQEAIRHIEAWARHIGCARVEAIARPGWERISKAWGYKKTHVLIERDL